MLHFILRYSNGDFNASLAFQVGSQVFKAKVGRNPGSRYSVCVAARKSVTQVRNGSSAST